MYGRIAQYVYFVCTFTLLSSNVVLLLAFSSTNLCKCLRLMSNMKIGVPEHILCSLFQAHQSASVDSHSVPVFFICCRTLFAPAWIEYLHVLFQCVYFSPFIFLVSRPCLSCSPPLFCVCLRGTEHMKLGALAGTYSMCIVSGPIQE